MLFGVSGAWWFNASLGCTAPRRTPYILVVDTVFEITKLEYSLTLRTLYTIAANRVAIDRYQCVRVLQARFVSVI